MDKFDDEWEDIYMYACSQPSAPSTHSHPSSRFFLNSRLDQREDVVRLGFLIEDAYWYYCDVVREKVPLSAMQW
jgi:hypothetical protein